MCFWDYTDNGTEYYNSPSDRLTKILTVWSHLFILAPALCGNFLPFVWLAFQPFCPLLFYWKQITHLFLGWAARWKGDIATTKPMHWLQLHLHHRVQRAGLSVCQPDWLWCPVKPVCHERLARTYWKFVLLGPIIHSRRRCWKATFLAQWIAKRNRHTRWTGFLGWIRHQHHNTLSGTYRYSMGFSLGAWNDPTGVKVQHVHCGQDIHFELARWRHDHR